MSQPHPSQQQRTALRPAAQFAAYTARYGAPAPKPDGKEIATARKHCAGRAGSTENIDVLAALAQPPDSSQGSSEVVSWMLSTIRVHECALLVTHCGVRHEDLARHVRAQAQHREGIVRFLNQFTVRDKPAETPQ